MWFCVLVSIGLHVLVKVVVVVVVVVMVVVVVVAVVRQLSAGHIRGIHPTGAMRGHCGDHPPCMAEGAKEQEEAGEERGIVDEVE